MIRTPARVLHVVGGMDRGGVETLLMSVYRRLDRSRLQFDFAVHTERHCDYDTEILGLGGRIFRHPRPSDVGMWRFSNLLSQTLRQQGPFSAVHSHVHHFSGLVLFLAFRAGIRHRIAHSHTTSDGHAPSLPRAAYRKLMRTLLLGTATHLFANSRASAHALFGQDIDLDRRLSLVPNALDTASYEVLPTDRDALRCDLGLPRHRRLIGHVGRFVESKNHKFLVDIFAELQAMLPSALLILVGDGPLRHEVEAHISRRGIGANVQMLGVRNDIPRILAALDLLIFPSLFEGLGNVVVEAQAAGLSCLVSAAVPPEADLGLGLLKRLSLDSGHGYWARHAVQSLSTESPSWSRRKTAITAHGYDVNHTLLRLAETYALVIT